MINKDLVADLKAEAIKPVRNEIAPQASREKAGRRASLVKLEVVLWSAALGEPLSSDLLVALPSRQRVAIALARQ